MTQPAQTYYYTSRTPVQAYQRCKRLRWLSTYEGEAGVGLEPVRKSIHLVVGSAVHAGMEMLLREGQRWLDNTPQLEVYDVGSSTIHVASLEEQLEFMFVTSRGSADGKTVARQIEDAAVEAALVDFAKEWGSGGVELDPEEAAAAAGQGGTGAAGSADNLVQITGLDLLKGQLAGSLALEGAQVGHYSSASRAASVDQDSPIIIDFGDFATGTPTTSLPIPSTAEASASAMSGDVALGASVLPGAHSQQGQAQYESNEEYLRQELSALVEGMVRAWARRRWRPLLEQFEVLEVEQEGAWQLATLPQPCADEGCPHYGSPHSHLNEDASLEFLSRHDALLLERSTQYLYLQSFKTTGTWDRRKELDALVDMQGLSEGVDVERRFEEAWHLAKSGFRDNVDLVRFQSLVSKRTGEWLVAQPDPPRILGVRYEYLLKGMRKKDKRDAMAPDRYVQESVLCRAWAQEGIISDDRRWAWTWDWHDATGKSRRLPWQSWHRKPVWKAMTTAEWIDKLDKGEVQGDALDERGERMDALAEQFVPVVVVYRNQDELLDLLEQLEAQEMQVVKDVVAVREAEARDGYAGKRSALNRMFPQTRTACSYPGICNFRSMPTKPGFCFGSPDAEHDPMVLEHFKVRTFNHPKENVLVQITENQ